MLTGSMSLRLVSPDVFCCPHNGGYYVTDYARTHADEGSHFEV